MVLLLFWEDVFVSFNVLMCMTNVVQEPCPCSAAHPTDSARHNAGSSQNHRGRCPALTGAMARGPGGTWWGRGGGAGGGYGGRGGGRGPLADAAHRMLNHSVHSMGLVSPGGYDPRASQGAYQQPPRNYDDQQASVTNEMCCNNPVSTIASVQ